MARVLVVYSSSYGHIEQMAEAVAEGAPSVVGTDVAIIRVADLVPEEVSRQAGMRTNQDTPIADPNELGDYDAIIFGTLTRYGGMAAQMRNFLDQTGGLWVKGASVCKVGSVFASTGTQHGGQETMITPFHTTLLHDGMIIVGLPYSFEGQSRIDEVTGGSPYGATTSAGGDGSRQPSQNELDGARFQRRHAAEIVGRLERGAGERGPVPVDMQNPTETVGGTAG